MMTLLLIMVSIISTEILSWIWSEQMDNSDCNNEGFAYGQNHPFITK